MRRPDAVRKKLFRGHFFRLAPALLILGAAACAPLSSEPAPSGPQEDLRAADFEAAIARLGAQYPGSPEALNARLEYADFLLDSTADACQPLATAQAQLDALTAQPSLSILLPLGSARVADDEYKIHMAHAGCGEAASARKNELEQALASAEQAMGLYRDGLDYQSAAIMQYNIAIIRHELGEADQTLEALEGAIAMDRDYGLRSDAADNIGLLLRWKQQPSAAADIATAMKDFPARTLQFKFDWSSHDADVAIAADDDSLVDGKPIHSHGAIDVKRQISAGTSGWTVSDNPGTAQYRLGDWPDHAKKSEWSMFYILASALMQAPTITIAPSGDFDTVKDAQDFGDKLALTVSASLDKIPSESDPASVEATARDVKAAFSPDFVEASAEQDYGIETGTWIGAKLEQGVWYQMTTSLFLPALGLGHYLVNQDITFAFTRELPCRPDAPSPVCAEIVLHVTPAADDLKDTIKQVNAQFKLPASQSVHYWARTDIRLLIDPETLLPYVRDVRQSWFSGLDGGDHLDSDPLVEQLRAVSTVSYH